MRKLITNNEENCVGCNRCIRACPIEGANIVKAVDGKFKVLVDNDRCVSCGACIDMCHHSVRDYVDDTERFLSDLRNGVAISMLVAPAVNVYGDDALRLLTWLRKLGVKKMFDVSLGADICTWAHIRAVQKGGLKPIITQPCPVIVDYVQMYQHDLIKHLSPVHSPMLCTAIYMKNYAKISENIAALSPCIAKAHEFDATGKVKYNVTLKKLMKYIEENNIILPSEISGYDHPDAALGLLYPMPGGLKENLEFFFGKDLRIDQSEGLCDDPGAVLPAPLIVKLVDEDVLRLHVLMQGGGPAIRAKTYRVFHQHSIETVRDTVVEWATEAVLQLGCSPCTLAVGIGRSHFEASALMTESQVYGRYDEQSELERYITDKVNLSKTGALGLGGDTSVLATFLKVGPQRASGVRIVSMRPCCCFEPRIASVLL